MFYWISWVTYITAGMKEHIVRRNRERPGVASPDWCETCCADRGVKEGEDLETGSQVEVVKHTRPFLFSVSGLVTYAGIDLWVAHGIGDQCTCVISLNSALARPVQSHTVWKTWRCGKTKFRSGPWCIMDFSIGSRFHVDFKHYN